MKTEELISKIIKCAYIVHLALPPGFYERLYQRALMIELKEQNINAESEVWLNAEYKNQPIGKFRVDIIVENRIILELKAVDDISPLNGVQLVNYLNLAGYDYGILINFGSVKFQAERKFRFRNKQQTLKQTQEQT